MPSCGVCVSVTFMDHVKTNKHIFKIYSPSGSPTILVFAYQTGWRYSDRNPPNDGVECTWGRQKTRFWTNIWLCCIQVYSVVNRTSREVWKTKRRALTAASVVCTRRRRSVCDGLELYTGEEGRSNAPLVITPVSCCHSTEPGGYFCWKLTLTRTPHPIRPTRRGPDPNQPTNGSKKGGLWPRGCFSGRFWSDTAGDNRDSKTEFNTILCTSKSEAAVTSNKTRGQSNLTKSASRRAHSPVRGHPRGSKFVPLNSWGRGSY